MAKIEDDEHEPKTKTKVLKDGERLRTPMYAMDAVQKSIAADRHPSLSKPGYRFLTDAEAKARIDDAHAAYRTELSNRWRTSDGGEGSPCTAPDGTPGILQYVAGKLVCTPQSAAKTSDAEPRHTRAAPVIDEGFDDGQDFYAIYDADVSSRWKGE